MSDAKSVTLTDLVGEHMLTGALTGTAKVESYAGDPDLANFLVLVLDGACYRFMEDPQDGYRSLMDRIDVLPEIPDGVITIPPTKVLAQMEASSGAWSSNYLEFIDSESGRLVAEVGTFDTDDYYPCFIGVWFPENLAVNADKEKP